MIKLAVIADDLTGANDTAVQFTKYGMRSFVLIDGAMEAPPDTDAVVVNTDSRSLTPAQARDKVRKACQWVQQRGVRQVIKKIDSTLRGNIGSEIEEAVQQLGCQAAIIAPSFPKTGRIAVGGYYLLGQQPINETEIACDPKTPVTESRLPEVIQHQASTQVAHVELSVLFRGQDAIAGAIIRCLEGGHRLITFDATTEKHLERIAKAGVATRKHLLWAGSAGLAEVLPGALGLQAAVSTTHPLEVRGPVLIVAGSMSSVTARQLKSLRRQTEIKTVRFDAAASLRTREKTIQNCHREGAKLLAAGKDVVLEMNDISQRAVDDAVVAGAEQGIAPDSISEAIIDRLSELAARLIECHPGAVVLTGGDTALAVCRRLHATGIRIIRELAPGVPLGCLSGGPRDGLAVISKAGAFGEEDIFLKILNDLKKVTGSCS